MTLLFSEITSLRKALTCASGLQSAHFPILLKVEKVTSMSITQFTNELKHMIAHASEFDHDEYVLALAIGSQSNEGQVRYSIGLAHHADKLSNAATDEAALSEVAVFMRNFAELPTTVMICHVQGIPRDVVVTYLSERFQEAASLPIPIDVGDVELLTIDSWEWS
jgi:hypothetical protein